MGHRNCGSCKHHVRAWVTRYTSHVITGSRVCGCSFDTDDEYQAVIHHYSCPAHCPEDGPEDCEMWEDWGDTGVEA
jgi:hypothetical protein